MKIRTYDELIALPTYEERYKYLRLYGQVGVETFGFDRIFYELFLRGPEWRKLRNDIFIRDNGCDLAVFGHEIHDRYFIHHMNPVSIEDIRDATDFLMNPNFLITVAFSTHNAIHYGKGNRFELEHAERRPNDTCPWKKGGGSGVRGIRR